jgi:hypothetical protein
VPVVPAASEVENVQVSPTPTGNGTELADTAVAEPGELELCELAGLLLEPAAEGLVEPPHAAMASAATPMAAAATPVRRQGGKARDLTSWYLLRGVMESAGMVPAQPRCRAAPAIAAIPIRDRTGRQRGEPWRRPGWSRAPAARPVVR